MVSMGEACDNYKDSAWLTQLPLRRRLMDCVEKKEVFLLQSATRGVEAASSRHAVASE